MPTWLIWLIVAVVVVVVVAALVALATRRRTAVQRGRAEELRTEASAHATGLAESQRQADELRARAELAQAEAERTQEQAQRAAQAHQVDQAAYEDKLREADRIDPDVDTRSGDYEPDIWNDESSAASPGSPRHAAPADDTTVAQRTEDPEAAATVDDETPRHSKD